MDTSSNTRATCLLIYSCVAVILLCAGSAKAGDNQLTLAEKWSTAFSGDEIVVHAKLSNADNPTDDRIRWAHTANQRTISRGEAGFVVDDSLEATAEITLRPRNLRDGVLFETTLTAARFNRNNDRPIETLKHRIWLFPRDPLAGRRVWAESLGLILFDPVGITAERLADIQLPLQSTDVASAAGKVTSDGVLIVGEQVSFTQLDSLGKTLLHSAQAGRRVLVLAPSDGFLTLAPQSNNRTSVQDIPGELRFSREHVITRLDKRLDAAAWQRTNNEIPSTRFAVQARLGQTAAIVTPRRSGWPWLEIHFPQTEGILIVCGFRIVEHWDKGPTPRFLLVRLLEHLSRKED